MTTDAYLLTANGLYLMIRSFIKKIFFKIISLEDLIKQIELKNIQDNLNWVVIGEKSKLYKEAKVTNLQNNKQNIVIGNNSHIRGNLQIFNYGGKIQIGNNCYIGENSYVWSGDSVIIEDHVLISHNVNIIDSNSHELNHRERQNGFAQIVTTGHPSHKGSIMTKPIIIKKHAWVSFNAIILKGVTIGEGAIVAAGSVVTKDVPDFAVVAGNPAVIVKYTD